MRCGPSGTLQVCHLVIMLPTFYNLATLDPCDSFNVLGKFPPQGLSHAVSTAWNALSWDLCKLFPSYPQVSAQESPSQRGLLNCLKWNGLLCTPRLSFSCCPAHCLADSCLYLSLQPQLQGSMLPVIHEHFCAQQLQEDFLSQQLTPASLCCP